MQYTFFQLAGDDSTGRRFGVLNLEERMTFREVLSKWATEDEFRGAYHEFLRDRKEEAIFWEHPKMEASSLDNLYECALVPSSNLAKLWASPGPFRDQISGVKYTAVFDNLGGDARMIVPAGNAGKQDYAHLLLFVRKASTVELQDFWRTVGEESLQLVAHRPVYLNTHGLGVSWLHVRLDTRPKYYSFHAYR